MTRIALLPALAAFALPALGPQASAQVAGQASAPANRTVVSEPALAPAAEVFEADLRVLAHVAATAALIHAETGAFPATSFALLGSPQADLTGVRAIPLRDLEVNDETASLRLVVRPLPGAPYTPDVKDLTLVMTPRPDGQYTVDHSLSRRRAAEAGGRSLPYFTAPPFIVDRASGELCIDPARVRTLAEAGALAAALPVLSAEPVTVRVTPLGGGEPVYYRAPVAAARP